MENELHRIVGYLVIVAEACGALVILLGVLRAISRYIRSFFSPHPLRKAIALRLQLGQDMVMGLEFQVAADILKTAMSPTWNDVLLLVALVALRTVLNFILEQELRNIAADAMTPLISKIEQGEKK